MLSENVTLTFLTRELLVQTVDLCDCCVGKNLYTKAELAETLEREDRQIFLLVTDKRKVVAYIYFKVTDIVEVQQMTQRSLLQFNEKIFSSYSLFGILQSIGVCEEYRNLGLAKELVGVYLQYLLKETAAEVAFGFFWKHNGIVPMELVLKKFGFSYLTDVKEFWFSNENLICPVCNGRCSCDAAIYYKKLERNEQQ